MGLKDVAKAAGVSPAVVSAVVNGSVGTKIRASEETVERIRRAVRELGYVPHPIARRLAGGRNYLLAVFTYEPIFPFEQRDFYYPFLLGIEREAEARGYDLLLITRRSRFRGDADEKESALNRLRIADGAILFGLSRDEGELGLLADSGFPLVSIGRRTFAEERGIAFVAADYEGAAAEVVARLARYGHTRFAYLRVKDDTEPTIDREKGFLKGIRAAGDRAEAAVIRCSPESLDADLLRGLRKRGVTAVVAERYAIAEALAQMARREEASIPGDLSVAVLGGPREYGEPTRKWAGFSIPDQQMGSSAVAALVAMIEGGTAEPQRMFLPCPAIPGDSIAPLPER